MDEPSARWESASVRGASWRKACFWLKAALMGTGPKYPNQQLRSVAVEVYFPGKLKALARFGEIQDAFADRLPLLFVPNMQPGDALALRPFQLRDVRQTRSLALALNQVSFIAFEYPGFQEFQKEVAAIVPNALRALDVQTANRVVYRYENEIGLSREDDGSLPLGRIFPGVLPVASGFSSPMSLDTRFERAFVFGSHQGTCGYHARIERTDGVEVLRVGIHAAVEECELTAFDVAMKASHHVAHDLFEKLISEEFRRFLSATESDPCS